MSGKLGFAWVTAATDEDTAKEAVVLLKSLQRVTTTLDAIILVSHEMNYKTKKLLSRHFMFTIPVNVKGMQLENKLSEMDLLKLFACTLEMYEKLVVLDPNNLVLQNCDEIFDLEKPIYYFNQEPEYFMATSPFVIKPSCERYMELLNLASSQQYNGLTEVLTAYATFFLPMEATFEMPPGYLCALSDIDQQQMAMKKEGRIVSYDLMTMKSTVPEENTNLSKIKDYWTSLWNDGENIAGNNDEININIQKPKKNYDDAIAVVGISCRFPEANNAEEYWELLKTGGSGKSLVPMERFQLSGVSFEDEGIPVMERSLLKCPIDEFDAQFFEIGRSDAEFMDPQQRLLLEVSWEALENACINPLTLRGGNTGVFSGFWQSDYNDIVNKNIHGSEYHKLFLGNLFSSSSSRISNFLGLNGPNIATESGCSSSMIALHLAANSLRRRETDLGLVMGANLTIDLDLMQEMSVIICKDGICKSFDEKADGFARAEGIAVLVVKRYSDAIKNRDRILGIVRGSAISSEGTSSSFGTPSKPCQEIAIQEALKFASVCPEEVDYVEAHGTGTPVGDPVEFGAISAAYTGKTKRAHPLVVGSVKTNIGHTEATAGLAGIIKVILAMKNETIPPHINFETVNPNINLSVLPAIIPKEQIPWKRNLNRPRFAGISSFGISGTNIHVIFEEPPIYVKPPAFITSLEEERSHHIITISAKSEKALENMTNCYANYLKRNPKLEIKDFEFTSNIGRAHFKNRLCVVGESISEIGHFLAKTECIPPTLNSQPKIAFLFNGIGSQYFGMGNILYKSNLLFRNAFEECSQIIAQKTAFNLTDVFRKENSGAQLNDCITNQLVIFALQYSIVRLFSSMGINPVFVLGNGVGEYAAAVTAGILKLKDALSLLIVFHSRDLDTILKPLENGPGNHYSMKASCSYVSGVTGSSLSAEDFADGKYWLRIRREMANFEKAINTLYESGCNIFVEIGLSSNCTSLGVPKVENTLWLPTFQENKNEWEVLLQTIGSLYTNRVEINWHPIHTPECRNKIELPTYPFQKQKYWINVLEKNRKSKVHPLLGKAVPYAPFKDTVYTVYKNKFYLKDFPYLKDHLVANLVVMPGAGFLEIILAAGNNLLLNRNKHHKKMLSIKDFVIENAMLMEEGQQLEIQVVAAPNEDIDKFLITVYSYKGGNGNMNECFTKHSSALAYLVDRDDIDPNYTKEITGDIKSRCNDEISVPDFYSKISKLGIQFGESFLSISCLLARKDEAFVTIPATFMASNSTLNRKYLYHPIILDAMLQAFAFIKDENLSSLHLPIGVGEILTFSSQLSDVLYAHVQWDKLKGSGRVSLYNKHNELLLVMLNISLVKTSIESFLNAMRKQKNELPPMFETVWRPRLGPLQGRFDVSKVPDLNYIAEKLRNSMKIDLGTFDSSQNALRDQFVSLNLMKLFQTNELIFEIGKEYCTSDVMHDNAISIAHNQFFSRCINILVEDGYIIRLDDDVWKIAKVFPPLEETEKRYKVLETMLMDYDPVTTNILMNCFGNLWNVLQAKLDPVDALFGSEDMSLLDMYTKGKDANLSNIRMALCISTIVSELQSLSSSSEIETLRIIEIGGGSASTSIEILKILKDRNIQCHYTFTDISSQFFQSARDELSFFDGVEFKVLDIEKDPQSQGFYPFYYDFVIASNVIHATEDLRTSVANIRRLLIDGGMLILQEQLKSIRYVDIIFGILEGYWKFTDKDLRQDSCMVSKDIWDRVLFENGFENSHCLSDREDVMSVLIAKARRNESMSNVLPKSTTSSKDIWLIFGEGDSLHTKVGEHISKFSKSILVKHGDQFTKDSGAIFVVNMLSLEELENQINKLAEFYSISGIIYLFSLKLESEVMEDVALIRALNFSKYVAKNVHLKTKVLVVTRGGECTPNYQDTVLPSGAIIWGMIKSLMNEVPKLSIRLIDLDPDLIDDDAEAQEISFETFESDEKFVCYRNHKKVVPRYVERERQNLLNIPKGRFKLQIPKSDRIEDLSFISSRKDILQPLDIEVAVQATALNFVDIFRIINPEMFSKAQNYIAVDFSGIVTSVGLDVTKFKVGDEVFCFGKNGIASHATVDPTDLIFHKPPHLNFFEAASIPAAGLTAHYCLVKMANLKPNETILIHTASGGVGLFAIQIAKRIGAKIIATAGSHRKRSYLRSIGIEHVFHSRDITFGDCIRKLTNGRGVDVVLNSLTAPGFKEMSLEISASNSRFIEMSKLNIWQPEDVLKLRPDVEYAIFDIVKSSCFQLDDSWNYICKEETLQPVPYSRFELSNIREAFNYFMKAQQIGKVLLSIPQTCKSENNLVSNDFIFSKGSTYLVTGGLNGIGLEVAKWMAASGAESLILVGRSPPNPEVVQILNKIQSQGCRILAFEVDIGNILQCKKLLQDIRFNLNLPPLKGVIHLAGVLSDAVFANQTWEKYQVVFNSKIQGCMNLHNFTQDLNLEHFVLFSSIAAIGAPIGQSNHSAANCFLDSFAHYRHSIGLPAHTINWGAWSGVGSAQNSIYVTGDNTMLQSFNSNQGIAALQHIMACPNVVQVGVAQFNKEMLASNHFVGGNYFEELVKGKSGIDTSKISNVVHSSVFWSTLEPKNLIERESYIQSQLSILVKNILRLSETEQINETQPFSELGIDSLMSLDLRNKLRTMVGNNLFFDNDLISVEQNLKDLSQILAKLTLESNNLDLATNKKISDKEIQKLVAQDSVLPNEIKGLENFVGVNEVRKILLTGVTGQMAGYLLREILRNPQMYVVCLVRGKSNTHARERVVKNLEKHYLLDSINLERVSVVAGDITEERLGLSNEEYFRLSSTIDAMYHMAAKLDLVSEYKSDIRSINVQGTINILRFAANVKTKRVFYASSIIAVNKLTPEGLVYEDFPDDDDHGNGITMGYALSKFVSEKLMKVALGRGIPCFVIRYPSVIGNSETGHFTVGFDMAMNLLLMCTQLGVIFNSFEGVLSFLSSDNAAQLTARLLFNDSLSSGVYTLWQPNPMTVIDFVEIITDLGYPIKIVSNQEFSEEFEKGKESPFLKLFKTAYGSNFPAILYNTTFILKKVIKEKNNICRFSSKILNVIPNADKEILSSKTLIKRCMLYAKTSDVFRSEVFKSQEM